MKPSWHADTYELMTTGWVTEHGHKRDHVAYTHTVVGLMLDDVDDDIVRGIVCDDFLSKARELGATIDLTTITMHWLDPRFPGTVMMERF